MAERSFSELILIRHGATDRPGHLCGRTDVGLADVPVMPNGAALADSQTIWVSPARRARQTATGLWPDRVLHEDARLWEQNFGAWDGLPYSEVPDVGVLSPAALAELKAEGGESFADVVARVEPALQEAGQAALAQGPICIVAHAGVIRAGLALAIGHVPGGLAFQVDHLSVTRLRWTAHHGFAVISVNETLGGHR